MALDLTKFSKATTNNAPPPASATGNALEGLGSAQVYENGVPFETGTYIATIDVVKLFPSRKKAADIFVVEFIIKETLNGAAKPGERRSWVQTINKVGDVKQRPMALSAIKLFVQASVPKSVMAPELVTSNITEITLGAAAEGEDGQALKGYEVRVSSTPNGEFQRLNFSGV